ncbi:hypothetical protein ACTXT7_017111 [Hymenolepis weldensis]
MSLGGFGIVILVGALLTTYIIRCTSGRGAEKGDEEKADGAAKLANDDLVNPKKDEKPTPSGDEEVKSSEGQPKAGDEPTAVTNGGSGDAQTVTDNKPAADAVPGVVGSSQQPRAENEPETPAAVTNSATSSQQPQTEAPIAATSSKPPAPTPAAPATSTSA